MRLQLLKLAATGAALAQSRVHAHAVGHPGSRVCKPMKRDVAILGGGSSGTYTAVRLQDSGKSVVVVEADDALGGHTETYTDPVTGQHDDFGVLTFHDLPVARDYFARLGIPVEVVQIPPGPDPVYFDFKARTELEDYQMRDPSAALQRYYGQLLRFPELLEGFDKLPDPVPEDLLLPFGQFAEKYGIQDAVPILALYGQGGLDYEKTTTLYIVKYLGPTFVEGLNVGTLMTTRRNNQELYEAAYDALGPDNVLLSSTVSAAKRSKNGVRLIVVKADGSCVDIRAKKLVVSVPPTLDKLSPLGLDGTEAGLFQRFTNVSYFTGIVRNSGLPADTSVYSVGIDSKFNLPALPGPLTITPAPIDGMTDVKYGSGLHEMSAEEAKVAIIEDLVALTTAINSTSAEPEFVTFKAHTPFQPMVCKEDIADGFYKQLWGLQGHRQTYFTGAAWQCHVSSVLWNFTEHRILPMLLK
ncbi:hypothetical protein DL764_001521 [Monosporascus ibericus]|uniref:Amine oxidase domain-containing protein n=1 Tax=Monosporascus ibericus TaxID=155417 RepID=A0A4Q4TP61_9PEZI|nr:hypothetical protein DL764_001521 [Monosporascus ibericus]